MNFGLHRLTLDAPYSLIVSVILILGFYKLGKLILKYSPLKNIILNISNPNYQYISLALLFTMGIFYPLFLFPILNKIVILSFSIIIFLLGAYYFYEKIINFSKNKFVNKQFFLNINFLFFLGLLIGYLFLAFAPISDADSLDYHVSVPIYIINNTEFPKDLLWFHAAKAGAGEVLTVFGLIMGAEQFPVLCQFSGILSVIGILLKKNNLQKKKLNNKNLILSILFLSIPALIFLASSAKPQLILIGFTSIAFAITFYGKNNDLSNENIFYKFFIVTLLLTMSFEGKFSFILSSSLIWSFAVFQILSKKKFNYFFYVIFIMALILIPSAFWKFNVYEGNFINKIYFPFLNYAEGYNILYNSISDCEWPCNKYFFILPNSLGRYTESLGIAILSIFFLFFLKKKRSLTTLIIIIIYISTLFTLGKFAPRFLIEPIIWSLIFIKFSNIDLNNKFFIPFTGLIYLQALITLGAIWFGVIFLSVGSINSNLKDKVLKQSAYGYQLAKWVNSEIEVDKKIIYTHRSISLVNAYTIPADFLRYSRDTKYLNKLKLLKPDYLVMQSNSFTQHSNLTNCTSGLYKKKIDAFTETSRNPINKRNNKYSAYIYHFNYKLLPDCYLKD